MKIKAKLRLGFGFLFVIVLLFGTISLYYMNQISASARLILKDNYETLSYTRDMRSILDQQELPLDKTAVTQFAGILKRQQQNITEKGEAHAVAALNRAFSELRASEKQPKMTLKAIRLQLSIIERLNMDAIVRKNSAAQQAVKTANLYLILAGSSCFLVLFFFIVNFPGFVANPLKEFSEAIKAIARKNYKQQLNFEGSDEFSELAKSFNDMSVVLNTEFKQLNEARTNFIATISHELKTPISSVKMSLKLLEDTRVGDLNLEQKQLVEHIKDDCSRLLQITGELLNLAQAETGQLQLSFVKADPEEIVRYAMNAISFQAQQRNIQLELVSNQNLPKVNADVEKTAWVLINFLSNALRYSTEHSKVQISIAEKDQSVEFSVRDYGKGIDEQYRKRLFDRYFQVPSDGNNKSGSGLGLAISKDFIEAENGTIWVESEMGEGSRFCFQLPTAK
ncbi:ATP-binding protein [Pedobacter sp. MC2016-15]|uniref:sensor histidine kinase n=1 Tax=Pedobacter sp. MC2016-15 TaxID=2994473 RepID=UPI002246A83A|nr:ATP-binding protein [Pedobacter sp. MC2016-15]MCX2478182.1 ATP-binding protein [Pedobacter sp. MC2016-15]